MDYIYPTEPYLILAGIVGYRVRDMVWQKQTRLRVMELLAGLPPYSIRSTKNLSNETIIDILNRIHPQWKRDEYIPTPEETVRQLYALCVNCNQYLIRRLGVPDDYATRQDIESAVLSLYEVES